MHRPPTEPLGLQLLDTAQLVSRAFDAVLGEVGGSMAIWLVMVSLKGRRHGAHRELAAAAALADPSSTDQLNHMESAGLITRTVAPENAEGHVVQLTAAGEQLFRRLLRAVVDFDALLRTGFSDQEIGALSRALGQVRSNVA